MQDVVLIAHIGTAILFIGPATVAAAMFPRRASAADGGPAAGILHRVTRVYGVLSLLVPALGIVLAIDDDVLDTAWVGTSILLSAVAAAVLWLVVRDQSRVIAGSRVPSRLPMTSGLFALLWVVILVLMVVRPG
jgi:hypothetical protein